MRKKCYHTVNYFKKNLFGNDKSAYFALCLKSVSYTHLTLPTIA